jgi:hypothetical protein
MRFLFAWPRPRFSSATGPDYRACRARADGRIRCACSGLGRETFFPRACATTSRRGLMALCLSGRVVVGVVLSCGPPARSPSRRPRPFAARRFRLVQRERLDLWRRLARPPADPPISGASAQSNGCADDARGALFLRLELVTRTGTSHRSNRRMRSPSSWRRASSRPGRILRTAGVACRCEVPNPVRGRNRAQDGIHDAIRTDDGLFSGSARLVRSPTRTWSHSRAFCFAGYGG